MVLQILEPPCTYLAAIGIHLGLATSDTESARALLRSNLPGRCGVTEVLAWSWQAFFLQAVSFNFWEGT